MNPFDQVVTLRKEEMFHAQAAVSTMNRFAGITLPRNPWMAPNNFGSPHQDSWCSESVSLKGPVGCELLLIEQFNPYGYTPNMVCNSQNQMIGVSLDYANEQFWVVVFDEDCNILSATPSGKHTGDTFGGGYFYLDNENNTITVEDNSIVSYPTHDLQAKKSNIYTLDPNWRSENIVDLIPDPGDENGLYSCLPVWDAKRPHLYWCLIAGNYNFKDYPDSELKSPAYMAVVEIVPQGNTGCSTRLVGCGSDACLHLYKLKSR